MLIIVFLRIRLIIAFIRKLIFSVFPACDESVMKAIRKKFFYKNSFNAHVFKTQCYYVFDTLSSKILSHSEIVL